MEIERPSNIPTGRLSPSESELSYDVSFSMPKRQVSGEALSSIYHSSPFRTDDKHTSQSKYCSLRDMLSSESCDKDADKELYTMNYSRGTDDSYSKDIRYLVVKRLKLNFA